MGGQQGSRPQPEDTLAPEPSLTAEQFLAQFTEDMREELYEGLDALRRDRVLDLLSEHLSLEQVQTAARRQMDVGMRALQLIAALAPIPYMPIGKAPPL